jgi:hypothetical protein
MMRSSPVEERFQQATGERLRTLEHLIELEWSGLRRVHDEAVRELRAQADALSRVSVAAANSTIAGLDRAETKLTAIDTALQQRITALSEQLTAALADVRAAQSGVRASTSHETASEPATRVRQSSRHPKTDPDTSPDVLVSRLALLETRMHSHDAALQEAVEQGERARRLLRMTATAAAVVLVPAAVAGWYSAARARDAERRSQAAVVAAERQVSAAREEAARQLQTARDTAMRSDKLLEVLAAPDLVRYVVSGVDQYDTAGQLLWSRSRGVVFSALRVPPPDADAAYQLWLTTDDASVPVGTFTPDGNGRVTFAADPPRAPRAVVGAAITIEPAGGSPRPSDRVLARTLVSP